MEIHMDIIIPHVIHVSIYFRISPYDFSHEIAPIMAYVLAEIPWLRFLRSMAAQMVGRKKQAWFLIMAKRSGRLLCKGSWFATLKPNNMGILTNQHQSIESRMQTVSNFDSGIKKKWKLVRIKG